MKKTILLLAFLVPTLLFSQERWKAPKEAKAIDNPIAESQNVVRGKALFDLLCTVCHGDTGRGDGVTLEHLNPKPANLTSKEIQSQTDGELYWKITTGRLPMQSYSNVLSSQEIWHVINYIRTLGVDE